MNNIYKNFIQILVITVTILFFLKICRCFYESFSGSLKNTPLAEQSNIQTNVQNLTVTGKLNILPSGIITTFAGSSIPPGWTLCDGTNGTPDLTAKFIVGTGQGVGLTNRPFGSTGGEITHTLTIPELGSHTHPYDLAISTEKILTHLSGSTDSGTAMTNYSGSDNTGNTGGGLPHNNMPPYYVLAYIMKL
jgi:microcystin-dependent protein